MNPLPLTLEGRYVRLVPLALEHTDDLWEAAREPSIWAWTAFAIRSREDMERHVRQEIAKAAAGSVLPFVQIALPSGTIVGSTRYMEIAPSHRRLEIGGTWLHPSWQRTPINTEAKYLLLRHAFEDLACIRVEFKTHSKNQKSLQALRRLGAVEEGTFRNHMIQPDGSLRDSVYFSILPNEWPTVKTRLEHLLSTHLP